MHSTTAHVRLGSATPVALPAIASECDYIRSDECLSAAATRPGGPRLRKLLDVHPIGKTSLIAICASGDDPNEVARWANTIAEVYCAQRRARWANTPSDPNAIAAEIRKQAEPAVVVHNPLTGALARSFGLLVALAFVVLFGAASSRIIRWLGSSRQG